MASFRLGRFFSQPEILRGIDPENLLSLLADHAQALEALGFALPEPDAAATIDYDALASLLMEPDKLPTGADLRVVRDRRVARAEVPRPHGAGG